MLNRIPVGTVGFHVETATHSLRDGSEKDAEPKLERARRCSRISRKRERQQQRDEHEGTSNDAHATSLAKASLYCIERDQHDALPVISILCQRGTPSGVGGSGQATTL